MSDSSLGLGLIVKVFIIIVVEPEPERAGPAHSFCLHLQLVSPKLACPVPSPATLIWIYNGRPNCPPMPSPYLQLHVNKLPEPSRHSLNHISRESNTDNVLTGYHFSCGDLHSSLSTRSTLFLQGKDSVNEGQHIRRPKKQIQKKAASLRPGREQRSGGLGDVDVKRNLNEIIYVFKE
ncbi:hypothetical protein J6590_033736 [Homalodisca vitripennis]|nr:hypothetical protein J6590_033736 [Homalodisca vitripennis]